MSGVDVGNIGEKQQQKCSAAAVAPHGSAVLRAAADKPRRQTARNLCFGRDNALRQPAAVFVRSLERYLTGRYVLGTRAAFAVSSMAGATWSWASVDGPITYHQGLYIHHETVEQHSQVINAECSLAGPSPTGQILEGFVELFCTLVTARLHPTIKIKLAVGTEEMYWRTDGRRKFEELDDLYLIPLATVAGSTECLVVTPKDQEKPDVIRVGLACGWKSLCDPWEKMERRTIKIV